MSVSLAKPGIGEAVLPGVGNGANNLRNDFLSQTYQRHYRELRLFVGRVFGKGPPDPEDVVQQAFLQFAAQGDLDRIENPRAFLYRTARNIVVSHHRRRSVEIGYQAVLHEAQSGGIRDDVTPERVIADREACRILEETIRRLPQRRRELLLLHRLHDLSYAEIARRTGLSQTAVKKHVALAVAACGAALEAMDETPDGECER